MKKILLSSILFTFILSGCDMPQEELSEVVGEVTKVDCTKPNGAAATTSLVYLDSKYSFEVSYELCKRITEGSNVKVTYDKWLKAKKVEYMMEGS